MNKKAKKYLKIALTTSSAFAISKTVEYLKNNYFSYEFDTEIGIRGAYTLESASEQLSVMLNGIVPKKDFQLNLNKYFIYENVLFKIKIENNKDDEKSRPSIMMYSYKYEYIKNFIKIIERNINGGEFKKSVRILSGNYGDYFNYNKIIKNINNKIFVSKHKKIINKHIETFIKTESNLKIILHGKPGTGKTSVLKYLISTSGIQFNMIDVSNSLLRDDINNAIGYDGNIFNSINTNGIVKECDTYNIVLLDEVDLILKNQVRSIQLLKLLDNLPNRCIIIITTNNYDALPEALKRKGRVDLVLEMDDFDEDEYNEYLSLSNVTDKEIEEFINNPSYKEKYAGYSKYNPATLESIVKDMRKAI